MSVITAPIAADLLRKALDVKGSEHTQQVCSYIVADVPMPDYFGEGALAEIGYEDALMREDIDTPDAKPGCLVGTALWLHDKDALIESIVPSASQYNGQIITDGELLQSLAENGIEIEPEALAIFNIAQEAQDGRGDFELVGNQTWGTAVFEATK